jgi:hypothetical protein
VCFAGFWRGTSFGQAAVSGLRSVALLVGAAGTAPAGGLLLRRKDDEQLRLDHRDHADGACRDLA